MSDPSSIRADFIQHLKSTNKEGSGKASSYVRALDILDELINEGKIQAPSSVWSLRAPADLKKLDTFVAEQQKTQNGVLALHGNVWVASDPSLPCSADAKPLFGALVG